MCHFSLRFVAFLFFIRMFVNTLFFFCFYFKVFNVYRKIRHAKDHLAVHVMNRILAMHRLCVDWIIIAFYKNAKV